jgi:hypothetical protein
MANSGEWVAPVCIIRHISYIATARRGHDPALQDNKRKFIKIPHPASPAKIFREFHKLVVAKSADSW